MHFFYHLSFNVNFLLEMSLKIFKYKIHQLFLRGPSIKHPFINRKNMIDMVNKILTLNFHIIIFYDVITVVSVNPHDISRAHFRFLAIV